MSIPEGSSLDNQGVDRQTYEPQNCGNTKPHSQHFNVVMRGLTLNCPGVAPVDPGAGQYWNKKNKHVYDANDPTVGKPFRHTRDRARLLLADLTPPQLAIALTILINKRPEDALDAIIEATGEE